MREEKAQKKGRVGTVEDQLRRVAERFDSAFAAQDKSPTLRGIRRQVYGADFPEEADPTSWVTLTDLQRVAAALGVGPGHTIVDLGSGRGGPGLWLARETGARLIGIDLSQVGVADANARAAAAGLADRARFLAGNLADTGLPTASCDGAVSLDVLALVPDKPAALAEVARLLRPGARFVFTTVVQREAAAGGPLATPVADYRPLLANAGLQVEAYEETPDWEPRQRAFSAAVLAREPALREEMGAAVAENLLGLARQWSGAGPKPVRMFVIARL